MHVRERLRIRPRPSCEAGGPSGPRYVTPIDMSVNVPSGGEALSPDLDVHLSQPARYAVRMICSLFMRVLPFPVIEAPISKELVEKR